MAALTHDDVLKILKIIDESNYDEVRLEIGELKIHVQKQGAATALAPQPAQPAPAMASQPQPTTKPLPPKVVAPEPIPEGMVAIRAPMVGTFYRASAPGEKPFVEVGGAVTTDDTLCLVEVMKLFNSIKAGVAGKVAKILVENGTLVEYDQPLMLIAPA